MAAPRTIRLRRPPTLSVQEGVYVPAAPPSWPVDAAASLLSEVDRRWETLQRSNPKYFDGRLTHVLGVHRNGHGGASLHVIDCAYRFFAVQAAASPPRAFDLGVRPLGVKGVVERDERFLMGKRAAHVGQYAELWEFAPSGSVDFGAPPQEVIVNELREETGLEPISDPVAIAVLFDDVLKCWEIVYRLSISPDSDAAATDEYPQVAWVDRAHLPTEMSPTARQIAELLGLI